MTKKMKKIKNKTKFIIHNFNNRYSVYSYYTFQSSKLAYFIRNDKNSITRDIFDRNIQNISPKMKRKRDYYQ